MIPCTVTHSRVLSILIIAAIPWGFILPGDIRSFSPRIFSDREQKKMLSLSIRDNPNRY